MPFQSAPFHHEAGCAGVREGALPVEGRFADRRSRKVLEEIHARIGRERLAGARRVRRDRLRAGRPRFIRQPLHLLRIEEAVVDVLHVELVHDGIVQVLADRVVQVSRPGHDDPLRRIGFAALQRRGIDRIDGQPHAAAAVPLEHIRQALELDVGLDGRDLGRFLQAALVFRPVRFEDLPPLRVPFLDGRDPARDLLLIPLLGLGELLLVQLVCAGDGHADRVQVLTSRELHERQAPVLRQQDELAGAVGAKDSRATRGTVRGTDGRTDRRLSRSPR